MLGLMQDQPLSLTHVFHRAEQLFGDKRIVTATATGQTATSIAEMTQGDQPAAAARLRDDRDQPDRHRQQRA